MNNPLRLIGMSEAVPNMNSKDIRFVLLVEGAPPLIYAGAYGVIAQIVTGLATALDSLKMALAQERAVVQISQIPIRQIQVQKALLAEDVVIEITSALGVPYVFQVPSQFAIELADRLKTAASQERPIGNA